MGCPRAHSWGLVGRPCPNCAPVQSAKPAASGNDEAAPVFEISACLQRSPSLWPGVSTDTPSRWHTDARKRCFSGWVPGRPAVSGNDRLRYTPGRCRRGQCFRGVRCNACRVRANVTRSGVCGRWRRPAAARAARPQRAPGSRWPAGSAAGSMRGMAAPAVDGSRPRIALLGRVQRPPSHASSDGCRSFVVCR